MKKGFLVILLLSFFLNPFTLTFAKTKIMYEKAENLALQFVENSLEDESWKGNNPRFFSEWKYFYTDDENNPSYIEFKIACDTTPDCWFILVNVDGDDVAVPISSTTWSAPSEVLLTKNWWTNEENKLYYFSPFEQYWENVKTGGVSSVNPIDNIDELLNNTKLTQEEKEIKRKESQSALKEKIENAKLETIRFKETDDFIKEKEKIKDQILKIPNEEFSMKILPMANADLPDLNTTYILPWTSNILVPTSDTSSSSLCSWRTPCYDQFRQNYTWTYGTNCASGCSPTAVAILYWYYDRNGFPNLLYWTAPLTNTTTVQTLVNILRWYMWTVCNSNYEWATLSSNIYKAKQYAIDMWYAGTTATPNEWIAVSTVFSKAKTEINAGRPVIITITNPSGGGHSVVGFGYKSTGTSYIVRVNMGWGWSWYYTSNWVKYYKSNLDQDLNAFFYSNSNNKKANWITTFKISN